MLTARQRTVDGRLPLHTGKGTKTRPVSETGFSVVATRDFLLQHHQGDEALAVFISSVLLSSEGQQNSRIAQCLPSKHWSNFKTILSYR